MATQSATSKIVPVVLAGGSGTRLWPLSREQYPKQFLRLTGETTLLQQTMTRLAGLRCQAPIVVCNEEHGFIVADQCGGCGVEVGAMVLEPAARNTAPAVALAAIRAKAEGADPVLFVLPADHHVADETAFAAAVERAIESAEAGNIVVFGINPSHPATGYGYIQTGAAGANDATVAKVTRFAEKPSRAVARRYLAEGGWYWNSGMFLLPASVYLDELARHRPDILEACIAAAEVQTGAEIHRAGDAFLRCPAESIDRAVMEKTTRGVVVPIDMGWSDVGSWNSLAEVVPWEKSVQRPWGHAETFRSGDGFRLKRLTVLPGKSVLPQVPEHRSTYWVVVRGLAEVASAEERRALATGESTYVPSAVRPCLTNTGEEVLVVVDVQTGSQIPGNFGDAPHAGA